MYILKFSYADSKEILTERSHTQIRFLTQTIQNCISYIIDYN
jgi:hypothetical protein